LVPLRGRRWALPGGKVTVEWKGSPKSYALYTGESGFKWGVRDGHTLHVLSSDGTCLR
jgi:hypothetical protein